MDLEQKNLYGFLDFIRDKPYLYIGGTKITTLRDNINGYELSCMVHGINEVLVPDWNSFHDFVAEKLNYSESTSGWKNMIPETNHGNEEMALL